jgi:mevalonate kinase
MDPQNQKKIVVTSAPGKIILFGEHVVVHGRTAIATSLDLRTYAKVESVDTDSVSLELPDINVQRIWTSSQLDYPGSISEEPQLDPDLLSFVEKQCEKDDSKALIAFLFLFVAISRKSRDKGGVRVQLKSQLKVGVGLGSSAAFNVCLSAAFLHFFQNIDTSQYIVRNDILVPKDNLRYLINQWAFQAEKIMHGTPSGIDNSVSTYGGAISFTKGHVELIPHIPPLKLLLTNTQISRNTKALVTKVGALNKLFPTITSHLFDSVDAISQRVLTLFKDYAHETQEEKLLELESQLEIFIDINQHILNALGVGHTALDYICQTSAEYNLHSKLTGAGGGGCAFTLIKKSMSSLTSHVKYHICLFLICPF